MAQSVGSNLRRSPAFRRKQIMEPPNFWTHWSDQFHLAIIAKEKLDIDNLRGPEVSENQILNLEQSI